MTTPASAPAAAPVEAPAISSLAAYNDGSSDGSEGGGYIPLHGPDEAGPSQETLEENQYFQDQAAAFPDLVNPVSPPSGGRVPQDLRTPPSSALTPMSKDMKSIFGPASREV